MCVVVVRLEGGGGRVLLPAPPRPKVILWEAVGWGSVRRMGMWMVVEMVDVLCETG